MHSMSDSKAVLQTFRVAELQHLLSSFGRSRVGRKHELLCRTLDMYKDPKLAVRLHAKVKELQRSRYGQRNHTFTQVSQEASMSARTYFPVHPAVKLVTLPFHEFWRTLVCPTTLKSAGLPFGRVDDATVLTFTLPTDVTETIKTSRIKPFDGKAQYKMQVMLRLCPLELSCPQQDQYPPNSHVSVNGTHINLPGYQPARTPAEHKKYGQSVDITPYLHLVSNVVNCVAVRAGLAINGQRFVAAIQICRNRTASDLLNMVKGTVRNADHSRALIKEKLLSDPDSEIATTSLRISLMCPLGKMRLLHPGRATTCRHLQCFDIATFLQMNERKARWVCPVCDGPAAFECLFIDGLLVEILNLASQSAENIELLDDGSWKPLQSTKTITQSTPPALISASAFAVPSLSTTAPACSSSSLASSSRPLIIDLTEDSDEEEAGPPSPPHPPPRTIAHPLPVAAPRTISHPPPATTLHSHSHTPTPPHAIVHSPSPAAASPVPGPDSVPGMGMPVCSSSGSMLLYNPPPIESPPPFLPSSPWNYTGVSLGELTRLFSMPSSTNMSHFTQHTPDEYHHHHGHSSAHPISLD